MKPAEGRRLRGVAQFAAGCAFGFLALALAIAAILVAFVGLAGAAIEIANLATLVFRVSPRALILAAPLLAALSLGTALLAVLLYRRL